MQRKEHIKISSMCGSTNQYANSQFDLHVDWKLCDTVHTRQLNFPVLLLIIQNTSIPCPVHVRPHLWTHEPWMFVSKWEYHLMTIRTTLIQLQRLYPFRPQVIVKRLKLPRRKGANERNSTKIITSQWTDHAVIPPTRQPQYLQLSAKNEYICN
jgi:hypothetical protein